MNLTPTVRRRIYLAAMAALPLLVFYGLLAEESLPLWAALVGSILVPGLAAKNTPRA